MKRKLARAMAVSAGLAAGALSNAAAGQADPAAPGACDWVTASEAAGLLGGPVTLDPRTGAADPTCSYSLGNFQGSVTSDLRLPAALPADAASVLANAAPTEGTVTPVDGLGLAAKCIFDQRTTPPSTTLLVLLSGGRLYRAQGAYVYCDTLKQFAQVAISRIG
jgi:hypothetical protein